MRKKIMAVVLSCLTFLTLIVSAAWSPMRASAVSMNEMTSVAVDIITKNEGTYGSINRNDNGAVSIGILQWHATRALQLMRSIANADPTTAQNTLGSTFYNEVMSATSWNTRKFSESEASAAASLLTSSAGVSAQNALAASDVQGYIEVGQRYGLTDASVLVYYAELYNRGSGVAARILSAANTNGYANITLSDLHNAAMSDKSNSSGYYTSRLTSAYNTLVSLNWGNVSAAEQPVIDETSSEAISAISTVNDTADAEVADETENNTVTATPEDFSESYAGNYVVNATTLNIRSAPDTDASKIGAIENGETIAVTSGNGSWAEVIYGEETGYCSMEYLEAVSDETELEEPTELAEPAETEPVEEVVTEPEETTTEAAETEPAETEPAEETTAEPEETTAEPEETTAEVTEETTAVTVQAYVEVEGVSNPEYATVYGDVNCDGEVDTKDAVLLQRYLDGYVLLNDRQLANADCQRDDVLDSTDVTVIMQYLVTNLTALPVL